MKGLILASGYGTRLAPLTASGNKHLLPIANKPMVLYGLEALKHAGIEDIGVVIGPFGEGIERLLGDGASHSVRITYIKQPNPRGIAEAIGMAEKFIGRSPFVVYLGDNILSEGIAPIVAAGSAEGVGCVVGVSKSPDPSRFGVVTLHGDTVTDIEEKPARPKSNMVLTGILLFKPDVFDVIKRLRPSARGELELVDAIRGIADKGLKVKAVSFDGWWRDAGSKEDMLDTNRLILETIKNRIDGKVERGAKVGRPVVIGKGSIIRRGAEVKAFTIIGNGCEIGNDAVVGSFASIGDGTKILGADVSSSIVMRNVVIGGRLLLTNSIVGDMAEMRGSSKGKRKRVELVLGQQSRLKL
ncbi:MAG: glucose-1-phosphate thymidylyltransferase [Candidatus Micrarchaeota archaeon]|nr:glucose-1-phosphate thymidylyltransferase [Candidatus Micrarchaeota archaeon]